MYWQYLNYYNGSSASLPICCLFAVSYSVPFGPLATLHFSFWAKMQRCNGEKWKVVKAKERKVRRSDGDAQRCKGEGTILLVYCSSAFALSPSHLCIFVFAFFSLFRSITYNFIQVSFSPKLFRMILFVISAHAPCSVAAIVLTIKVN